MLVSEAHSNPSLPYLLLHISFRTLLSWTSQCEHRPSQVHQGSATFIQSPTRNGGIRCHLQRPPHWVLGTLPAKQLSSPWSSLYVSRVSSWALPTALPPNNPTFASYKVCHLTAGCSFRYKNPIYSCCLETSTAIRISLTSILLPTRPWESGSRLILWL